MRMFLTIFTLFCWYTAFSQKLAEVDSLINLQKYDEGFAFLDSMNNQNLITENQYLRSKAALYEVTNSLDKANDCYLQMIEIDSTNFIAYNNIGVNYAIMGDTPRSIEYYFNAVKINDDYASGHFNLAMAFANYGEVEKGCFHAYKAKELGFKMADKFIEWHCE